MNRRCAVLSAGAAAAALTVFRAFAAEDIRIIVANPPGGQTDLFARAVAQGIQTRMGHLARADHRRRWYAALVRDVHKVD